MERNLQENKKVRNSNLELYRIIVMILIVAHHYVWNSGVYDILKQSEFSSANASLLLFGAWGKTGINCFVLITGYFMCKSYFSWRKLYKLYSQIVFYTLTIYCVFCITGHEYLSLKRVLNSFMPVNNITGEFNGCFLLFYLFIPFINIFIQCLNKTQHKQIIILNLIIFSIWPTLNFTVGYNYVIWFIILYIIASYIRLYGIFKMVTHVQWGWLSLISLLFGSISVISMYLLYLGGKLNHWIPYFFISDCNKILSLAISVCSFMWFKDLKLRYSRFINAIGATTFGILLIHGNSEAMKNWLWREMVDCVGHIGDSILLTLGYAFLSVFIVFIVCSSIDWFRGKLIEPGLMNGIYKISSWYKKAIISKA